MEILSKPTRKQLMQGITTLQQLIGDAETYHADDRDDAGFQKGQQCLRKAHALCIELRSHDAPTGELPGYFNQEQS